MMESYNGRLHLMSEQSFAPTFSCYCIAQWHGKMLRNSREKMEFEQKLL